MKQTRKLISLAVGQPYPFPLQKEGATANFLMKEGNLLQLMIPNITPPELKSLKKGAIKAGFLEENNEILWIFQFFDKKNKATFTFDAPFDSRLIPADIIALHDITNHKQRLAIEIHVVDSGITKALRIVTLSNKQTINFLSAVQDQLTAVATNSMLKRWMMLSPDDLSKKTKMEKLG